MKRSISRRAETTCAGLSAGAQAQLHPVFRDLVQVDERGAATEADDLRLLRQAEAAAAGWVRIGHEVGHLWPQERLEPVGMTRWPVAAGQARGGAI